MIRNIQGLFKITATLVIGSLLLWNCEPDADRLGSQFFQDGAVGVETSFPLIAYTVDNNDSIRADASRLQGATLGAFNEPVFGLQKSSYVTQVRLNGGNPDFGANPKLDSAVLVIKPQFAGDSVTTVTKEEYIFPKGAVAAKMEIKTYPVSKYGNRNVLGKTMFNIKVEEVTEFLGSSSAKVFSNREVTTGEVIGTKLFDGDVSSVKVTADSDNSTLLDLPPGFRIKLDSTFISNKILSKATAPELSDAASFIRYFKGIKLSVEENDGYLFNFDPNGMELNLYYKNDKVTGDVTTRESAVFLMNLGNANVHFNQIETDKAGVASYRPISPTDQIAGVPKVYAQGMGGPGIGLRVSPDDISTIRTLYNDSKIAIVSAKLRIYTDESWANNYKKPNSFVVRQRNLNPASGESEYLDTFLSDLGSFGGSGLYQLVRSFDLEKNPAHYDIGVTQTIKNIVEITSPNYDFILNVGDYTTDQSGSLLGALFSSAGPQNFTTRAFSPYRAVFIGTDASNPKSAQLILTYGQKP